MRRSTHLRVVLFPKEHVGGDGLRVSKLLLGLSGVRDRGRVWFPPGCGSGGGGKTPHVTDLLFWRVWVPVRVWVGLGLGESGSRYVGVSVLVPVPGRGLWGSRSWSRSWSRPGSGFGSRSRVSPVIERRDACGQEEVRLRFPLLAPAPVRPLPPAGRGGVLPTRLPRLISPEGRPAGTGGR